MFDKQELLNERGNLCACGCMLMAHDAHHCLIPNLKRFSEYVNTPLNIALVNHAQHINRMFDNRYWRHEFYLQNVKRYGQKAMQEWIDSLPAKMRHRVDFL